MKAIVHRLESEKFTSVLTTLVELSPHLVYPHIQCGAFLTKDCFYVPADAVDLGEVFAPHQDVSATYVSDLGRCLIVLNKLPDGSHQHLVYITNELDGHNLNEILEVIELLKI